MIRKTNAQRRVRHTRRSGAKSPLPARKGRNRRK